MKSGISSSSPPVRLLWVLVVLVSCCHAHIRLTWPPARTLDLDFLDNIRTPGPCGMAQGPVKATFQKGETINVTWHLAYPHVGGFKLEVLEGSNVIHECTNGFIGGNDVTQLSYEVQLPANYTCNNCTLRLMRQALEWGQSYTFWSCSDISIVQVHHSYCSQHGTYTNGRCECDKLYRGTDCQYKDECDISADCSLHGLCVNTNSTFYPKKQCYCDAGWFGDQCQQRSVIEDTNFYHSDYDEAVFADGDFILKWRVIEDEVEIVMISKGESYAAVGFRPHGTGACANFGSPNASPEPEASTKTPNPEPEASTKTPNPEPEASTKTPNPEPEASTKTPNPEPEASTKTPNPEPEASTKTPNPEPEASTKTPNPEPEASTKTPNPEPEASTKTPNPEPEASTKTPNPEPEASTKIPNPEPEASTKTPNPEPEASTKTPNQEPEASTKTPNPEPEASTKTPNPEPEASTSKSNPEPEASTSKANPEPEASTSKSYPEPEASTSKSYPEPEPSTTKANPEPEPSTSKPGSEAVQPGHPMDCTDVIIGTAIGHRSRIGDYYTRDRSSPRPDSVYARGATGLNSLTSAVGEHRDGYTTIIFRRKLQAADAQDHSIVNEQMHVIWARGQQPSVVVQSASIPNYFKKNELKYHGRTNQRGYKNINFFC